jgi:hypothetical protein
MVLHTLRHQILRHFEPPPPFRHQSSSRAEPPPHLLRHRPFSWQAAVKYINH